VARQASRSPCPSLAELRFDRKPTFTIGFLGGILVPPMAVWRRHPADEQWAAFGISVTSR
jgi:hypothetical protein